MKVSPAFIARLCRRDVEGAPFQIGARVKVVDASDDISPQTRTFIGRVGTIKYYDWNCGCGQLYPDQPMIGVRLDPLPGRVRGRRWEFWPEELEPVRALAR